MGKYDTQNREYYENQIKNRQQQTRDAQEKAAKASAAGRHQEAAGWQKDADRKREVTAEQREKLRKLGG